MRNKAVSIAVGLCVCARTRARADPLTRGTSRDHSHQTPCGRRACTHERSCWGARPSGTSPSTGGRAGRGSAAAPASGARRGARRRAPTGSARRRASRRRRRRPPGTGRRLPIAARACGYARARGPSLRLRTLPVDSYPAPLSKDAADAITRAAAPPCALQRNCPNWGMAHEVWPKVATPHIMQRP